MKVIKPPSMTRRSALIGAGAVAAAAVLGRPAEAKELVTGIIHVGSKDDYGYNQAHAEATAMLKKVSGLKIVEEAKVPETDDVSRTMESMIDDPGTAVFIRGLPCQ